MNILDTAYNTVHDFPGGATALAPRMGIKSHAVLNSKVNPNTETHHLTLMEAVKIMQITGDYRILHAINAQLGKVSIDLPDIPESQRDVSLMEQMLEISIKKGDVTKAFKQMIADGRITRGEAMDMDTLIYELVRQLNQFKMQMMACVNPSPCPFDDK
ncbi:phage regulatory CII family protein [Moraxella sp. ZY210820]|uniref:phage regulatory CII family protein n=1 Tax=unclassified Moraxella TaxID=2685852 RepID=UPI00272F3611|nr:phage regulatory CII family protein [Moraxella sp. ZY210820]WLF83777.1 phage regulatory CII family protein [Moraxella sp. ZY210820]